MNISIRKLVYNFFLSSLIFSFLIFCAPKSNNNSEVNSSTNPLLILGAVQTEIEPIVNALNNKKSDSLLALPYTHGYLHNHEIIVTMTGVAKTNASMVASIFISHFQPKQVIMTGTGARLNPEIRTGDIVIAKKIYHHDLGCLTTSGMFYSKIEGPIKGTFSNYEYTPDSTILHAANKAVLDFKFQDIIANGKEYKNKVITGIVCTGDLFGVTELKIRDIKDKLNGDIMEMESAAVAQVCKQLNVPYLIIRSGSNLAQEKPSDDYKILGPIAARQAAIFTMHLIKYL